MKAVSVISLKNIAVVNTLKIKNNLLSIKKYVRKGVSICAVVKADAYGHGAVGIARILEPLVDYFAVSLVEEGIELRLSGIQKPVLVLIPTDYEGAVRASRYSLTLTIAGFNDIKNVDRAKKATASDVECHIKLNTGMNRFGFNFNEAEVACHAISGCGIKISGCYSHFYNPCDGKSAEMQYCLFLKAKSIVSSFFADLCYHISASGGILCGRKYDLDMVRPGLLIYGYKPFCAGNLCVEPALSVTSSVVARREIKRGEPLLYGEYRSSRDEEISIVRTGYADGFTRSDSNVLNSRCMDVSAYGFTDKESVVCFSDAYYEAQNVKTITYDVLCRITRRARIIYKEY